MKTHAATRSRYLFLLAALLLSLIALGIKPQTAFAQATEPNEIDDTELPPSPDLSEPTTPAAALQTRPIPWRALVQFEKGGLTRSEASGKKTNLVFKDAVFEGDRIELASSERAKGRSAAAKLKTREDCALVMYANTAKFIAIPPDLTKPWRLKGDAARLVCPAGTAITALMRGHRIEVLSSEGGSELMIETSANQTHLLLLKGKARVFPLQAKVGTLIEPKIIYRIDRPAKGHEGALISETTDEEKVYNFNTARALPLNAEKLEIPISIPQWRVVFGPAFGTSTILFDNDKLDAKGQSAEGGRLHLQKQWGERSFIAMLNFRNSDSEGFKGSSEPNSARSRSEFVGGEFGVRLHHAKPFSPFIRVGFGQEKAKVDFNDSSNGFYGSDQYEFYSLSAAIGVDAMWSPRWLQWLGVYGSAEGHLTQSLGRGARENLTNYYSSFSNPNARPGTGISQEAWRATTVSFLIHFGAMVQFK